MPGIAGIISPIPDVLRVDQLQSMIQRMVHEPALKSGHSDFDRVRLTAGWVSRPDSFSDCMPVWNEARTVCLILTGEEFSSGDQLSALKHGGHGQFREDASALVHLYEDLGPAFFTRLNGWFSGVLVDLRNDTLTLFNDRYGLSRIYVHEAPEGFYFASEAKSLLTVLPGLRRIDQRGLAECFTVGCVLQNRSLFAGISLLPPGALWTFHRDGRVDKQRYFKPETWERQETLSPTAYGERLREVFGRIAPRYLRGREKVGMSLTGGLDSRMIMAWNRSAPGTVPCYTFGGPYRDCRDVRIARQLARVCSQPHTTIPIGQDFFRDFPGLAEKTVYVTDGAMDVSGAVELHVNRLAREIAPVRLTGNYGSEILRSNVAFGPRNLDTSVFTPEFARLIQEAGDTYRSEAQGHRLSLIAFKQVPWHHYARLAVEQSQLTMRSPFLDNELVALAYQAPPELATSPQPLLQLIADGNPALDTVQTDRSLSRRPVPMISKLTNAWQEFTAKAEYAYDYGMPDRLARFDRVFKPFHFEKLFLGRHKFYHFRIWYRDQLAGHVRALVRDAGSMPACYREGAVGQIVEDHLSGRRNRTMEMHKMLSTHLMAGMLMRKL